MKFLSFSQIPPNRNGVFGTFRHIYTRFLSNIFPLEEVFCIFGCNEQAQARQKAADLRQNS
jgi:hypothetical protein